MTAAAVSSDIKFKTLTNFQVKNADRGEVEVIRRHPQRG
jgi:hypothetical protein